MTFSRNLMSLISTLHFEKKIEIKCFFWKCNDFNLEMFFFFIIIIIIIIIIAPP